MNSRLIAARFAGRCRTCGKSVAAGESVYFAKHYGVRCAACGPHTADDAPLPAKKGSKRYSRDHQDTPRPTTTEECDTRKRRRVVDRMQVPPEMRARFAPTYTPASKDSRLAAECGPDGVHRLLFESVTDLVEDAFTDWAVCEDTIASLKDKHSAHQFSSWANGHDEKSLREALINPKEELVKAIEAMRAKLLDDLDLPATPRRRVRRGQDWGDELDPDRWLARDPQGWTRIARESQPTKTVTIGVNLTVCWHQDPQQLLYRGAAACALADVLTARGVNVRILGFSVGEKCSARVGKAVTMVEFKAADMPLDIAGLATALCDIGFYRMGLLFAEGRHLPGKVSNTLGFRGVDQYLPGADRLGLDYLVEHRVTNEQAAMEWLTEQMTRTTEVEATNV